MERAIDPADSTAALDAWAEIERAKNIVMARRQCTEQEALLLMSRAASSHEMQPHELATCIIANRELEWLSDASGASDIPSKAMSVGVQPVKLEGGTADAWIVQAALPPATHRMDFDYEGRRWSELYRYADGRTAVSEVHGELPLMVFTETSEDD